MKMFLFILIIGSIFVHTYANSITIDDNVPPTLTAPADLTAECDIIEQPAYTTLDEFIAAGGDTLDNYGIDPASFILISEESDGNICPMVITRIYQIADLYGNIDTATQTITINDEINPVIECPTDQVRLIPPFSSGYTAAGDEFDPVGASDNCNTPALTNSLNGGTTLDGYVFEQGDTEVTWTATDACGNTSSCTFIVSVLAPGLSMTKTQTSTEDITSAGQIITYDITITNTGTSDLTGVDVTEIYPGAGAGSLNGPVESISENNILDVGETWTYTTSYTVTQADIDAGDILINTVTVSTSEIPEPITDTESTTLLTLSSLSIEKTQTSNVYPNPANDLLTIEISQPGQHFIVITSLSGQLLYNQCMEGPNHQIDLSSFENGLYFITIRSRDYVRTEKIIKL